MRARVVISMMMALCATLACAVAARAQDAKERTFKPAGAAIDALVRDVLADRYVAGGIPDQNLLGKPAVVFVLREMRNAGLTLTPDALPTLPSVTFELIALEDVQRRATEQKTNLFFVEFDRPRIDGDAATLDFGVDVVTPDPHELRMCCCIASARISLVKGRWRYVGTAHVACA